ncbi:hypothetical protein SAMN05216474_2937 [Lishizhenia tianjinensis]|uniref:Zinc-finger n=1 Tax=Lishizhenia tianjinensis TaxID=477690 RepID=A0A1I7BNH1_9FLAO|nr:hypothetical protein SAMN05216474_2937 [Lishizhenia tianjinensis]
MSKHCEEIQILHEEQLAKGVGFLRKTRIRFHLLMCKCCRDYTSCSEKIDRVLSGQEKNETSKCTEEEKGKMKAGLIQD